MPKFRLFLFSAIALITAVSFCTLPVVRAATVVETQPIIVVPQKAPAGTTPPATPPAATTPAPVAGTPEIHKATDELPAPVAAMRKKILDTAYSGDMEKFRALIQSSPTVPQFSINEITDPIEYLKTQSGDGAGLEILAIMTDVLEEGWAHVGAGTPQEMYVWPYFAVLPMDKLTPQQLVDVYKLVTSGDFEEMKNSGTYSFYALGISPDGTWRYFKPNN